LNWKLKWVPPSCYVFFNIFPNSTFICQISFELIFALWTESWSEFPQVVSCLCVKLKIENVSKLFFIPKLKVRHGQWKACMRLRRDYLRIYPNTYLRIISKIYLEIILRLSRGLPRLRDVYGLLRRLHKSYVEAYRKTPYVKRYLRIIKGAT